MSVTLSALCHQEVIKRSFRICFSFDCLHHETKIHREQCISCSDGDGEREGEERLAAKKRDAIRERTEARVGEASEDTVEREVELVVECGVLGENERVRNGTE